MEKLTPREEELMRCFWTRGPLFVRELVALWPEPKPHFNTLSTMVRGLEAKGYVGHKAYGLSLIHISEPTSLVGSEMCIRDRGLWRHLPVLSARQRGGVQPQDAEGRGEQVFRQFLPRGGFVARTGGENLRGRSARPDPANRKSNRKTIVLCRPFCFTV